MIPTSHFYLLCITPEGWERKISSYLWETQEDAEQGARELIKLNRAEKAEVILVSETQVSTVLPQK